MAAIFPKSSDIILKVLGAVIGLGAVSTIGAYVYLSYPTVIDTGYQPEQPVAYSHKLHAGQLGLNCFYCHYTVYRGAYAAIPGTEICMGCHQKVKDKSPRLELVRQSYESGEAIPWKKIHIMPDYVYFNHRAHVTAGVSCVSCHGRIDQMVEVHQEKPLNMAMCLACHRDPAPNVRPADLVTKLDWVPDRDPREIGREIIARETSESANQLLGVPSVMEMTNLVQINGQNPTQKSAAAPEYWRSLDQLAETPEFQQWVQREFPEDAALVMDGASRRSMLKIMAASFGLAGLAACRRPELRMAPQARGREDYVPGSPYNYTSAFVAGRSRLRSGGPDL